MVNIVSALLPILDKFIPDKDEKHKLAHEIATIAQKHAHEIAQGQIDTNQQEAKHKSVFVAGWRPFVGWVCGFALAYHFIVQPFLLFALLSLGVEMQLPEFDLTELNTILLGLLGLGGLRSFEKTKNVARSNLRE